MKRWAVFIFIEHYPCGGMGEFVVAFDTKAEAEDYVVRRARERNPASKLSDQEILDHGEPLYVEDMTKYLGGGES